MVKRLSFVSVAAMLLFAGCQGGDVADGVDATAESATPQAAESELDILPLDEVKASQSGEVSQTIATTQITVTYDRPVNLRGHTVLLGAQIVDRRSEHAVGLAIRYMEQKPLDRNRQSVDRA